STLRWERRRVTVIRATISGAQGQSDTWARKRTLELLAGKILGFGGRLEALSGSGIDASFGVEPIDEAPRRAALAAMAIQKATANAHDPSGHPLAVKTVIHTSQQLIAQIAGTRQTDREAQQATWSVVEGLVGRAPSGAILVSPEAEPFLDRQFKLEPLEEGPAARPSGYVIIGHQSAGAPARGDASQFVGRRPELEVLATRWRAAT